MFNETKMRGWCIFHRLHYGASSSGCCSPDHGSSPFRCHWTENFVSQTFPTSHWTSVFDRAQEGRPLRLEKKKKKKRKKNSSRSEYQSERSSGDRKRKRKPRSGRTERQDRIETITPAGLDLTRGRDGTVCRPNFDAALLVTVGITLDTW